MILYPTDVPLTELVAAVLVGVLGVARIVRAISQDTFPLSVSFRDWWRKITHDGKWSELVDCPFCVAPYVAGISLAWAILSGLHWTWWVAHAWAALAYLAAMVVAQDT